jgi:hypothetical protein
MDAIFEIPMDVERAWATASQTYDSLRSTGLPPLQQPWVRRAQLLVAAVRETVPNVSTDSVRAAMKAAHERVFAENRTLLLGSPTEGTALPMRFAVSFARLVSASARADGRADAQPEDVELALSFLSKKLEFMHLHGLKAAEQQTFKQKREDFVRQRAGTIVDPADLASRYQQATGEAASEKSIRRDLAQLGAKRIGKGSYLLPDGTD